MNKTSSTGTALRSTEAHTPSVLGRQLLTTSGEGNNVFTAVDTTAADADLAVIR